MFVGDAGTCVGSRLKGHTKWGGKRLRRVHMASCPVVITDEYRTSKTCSYCYEEVELATARRIVHGMEKMVRVHGAVECTNDKCPSFKVGYTTKPRDPHAALAIALSGSYNQRYNKPFPPCSRAPLSDQIIL
ncbi:hypothetical protein EC968_006476 [Mortierella alpina]|nr:hypothetical protein EC968_006476 [Mortierella alpina]